MKPLVLISFFGGPTNAGKRGSAWRVQTLLTEEEADVVVPWTSGSRKLARCLSHVRQQYAAVTAEISSYLEDLGLLTDKDAFHGLFATLSAVRGVLWRSYSPSESGRYLRLAGALALPRKFSAR